eukprot:535897-Rhodomonas_salina.2
MAQQGRREVAEATSYGHAGSSTVRGQYKDSSLGQHSDSSTIFEGSTSAGHEGARRFVVPRLLPQRPGGSILRVSTGQTTGL